MLDQLRNLKYDLKKNNFKFDVKCNLNLILAKLNFGIRTVALCKKEFQTWKALNLINPTKIQAIIPKQKKTKKKEKQQQKCTLYIHYLQFKNAAAILV